MITSDNRYTQDTMRNKYTPPNQEQPTSLQNIPTEVVVIAPDGRQTTYSQNGEIIQPRDTSPQPQTNNPQYTHQSQMNHY